MPIDPNILQAIMAQMGRSQASPSPMGPQGTGAGQNALGTTGIPANPMGLPIQQTGMPGMPTKIPPQYSPLQNQFTPDTTDRPDAMLMGMAQRAGLSLPEIQELIKSIMARGQ